MKKVFILVIVLALLAVGASVAFAADEDDNELVKYHEEMLKLKQEQLDELVADGIITQEEADAFIAAMEERFESGICYATEEGTGYGMFRGYGRGRNSGVAGGTGYGVGAGYGCGGARIVD